MSPHRQRWQAQLDEKAGTYMYKNAIGRKATLPKADIVRVMER